MKTRFATCRWLFIIAVVGSTAFLFSCNENKKKEAETAKPKEVWTCSMHPEVIRDGPGGCPICGMDLIKKEEHAVALKGIEIEDLLQPTNQFVQSSISMVGLQNQRMPVPVDVWGMVTYDTRGIHSIAARVSGRIEKIYVHYRYQHIKKGERIMDIYSPELETAQQELLFLIKNDPENAGLIQAGKQKLILLGMNEEQINGAIHSGRPSATVTVYSPYNGHLHEAGNSMPLINTGETKTDGATMMEELPIKEGMYVEKGQNIFQLFNTDNILVLLNIFPESQGIIKTGDPVNIIPETHPNMTLHGKIDFIEPVFRPGSKTLTARVYLTNSMGMIPIGTQVRASISTGRALTNWLPKDAVLSLGSHQIVFLKTKGGFRAHKVITGFKYKDQVQIVSGLNERDSVAANGQYLADSESFIKVNQ